MPKSGRNKFCCRFCFKKDFYSRKKDDSKLCKFPSFDCPACGERINLDFDPVANPIKWSAFSCPSCNTLLINVCEFIQTEDESIA